RVHLAWLHRVHAQLLRHGQHYSACAEVSAAPLEVQLLAERALSEVQQPAGHDHRQRRCDRSELDHHLDLQAVLRTPALRPDAPWTVGDAGAEITAGAQSA